MVRKDDAVSFSVPFSSVDHVLPLGKLFLSFLFCFPMAKLISKVPTLW